MVERAGALEPGHHFLEEPPFQLFQLYQAKSREVWELCYGKEQMEDGGPVLVLVGRAHVRIGYVIG